MITVGDNTWCASTSSASYCWGENDFGQVGNGNTTDQPTPVPVQGGRVFVRMGVSQAHACGITASGAAYCWGKNDKGELGDGTLTARSAPVRVRLAGR